MVDWLSNVCVFIFFGILKITVSTVSFAKNNVVCERILLTNKKPYSTDYGLYKLN